MISLSSGIEKQKILPQSEFSLLTWPVTAPCVGFRDDKRSAGSNRFSDEADEDQVEVDQAGEVEDTHAGTEAKRLAGNHANLKLQIICDRETHVPKSFAETCVSALRR